jgi:hypothetical protein
MRSRILDRAINSHSGRLVAVSALFFALALTLGAHVAQAETVWAKNAELGGFGFESGQFWSPHSPEGLAVAPSGDLYAVDGAGASVEKFGSSAPASFLLTFGWSVNKSKTEEGAPQAEQNICNSTESCITFGSAGNEPGEFARDPGFGMGAAVSPVTSDIYVVDSANNRVEYFDGGGKYVGEFNGSLGAPELLNIPTGIAVSPLGNVYVFDFSAHAIEEFTSTGTYVCEITGTGTPSSSECDRANGSETPNDGLGGLDGDNLAIDTNGDVYVGDAEHSVVDEFGPEGAYVRQFGTGELQTGEPKLQSGGNGMAVAVDSTGDVFAANEGTHEVYEFESSGPLASRFGGGLLSGENWGIASAGSGRQQRIYVSDGASQHVYVFTPGPACTTVAPATSVTATSATVPGMIEPNGNEATYHFDYGLSTAYGSQTPADGPVSGNAPVPVAGSLTGLQQPNQTYHYKLVIVYGGHSTECGDQAFQTAPAPPTVDRESAPASSTSNTEATLEAQINPNNEDTTYRAEYSTQRSGQSLIGPQESVNGTLAAAFGDQSANPVLIGLQPSTLYYYRVVATDGVPGQGEGPIQTLLTRPASPATGTATAVSQSAATLEGSLNPGGPDTQFYFEYGTAPCRGTLCGAKTSEEASGVDATELNATAALTGLQSRATYHYRLVAVNATGPSFGPEREFTTSMPAITGPPTTVGPTSATVSGEVLAGGLATAYRMEYGPTAAYGASVPAPEGDGGSSTDGRYVSVELSALQPDTSYHYRLVTSNSSGTGQGEDRTFHTNAIGAPSTSVSTGFALTGSSLLGAPTVITADFRALAPLPTPAPVRRITKPPKLTARACQAKAKVVKGAKKRKAALERCRKANAKPRTT